MRPSSSVMPAARALHERLLAIGLHPALPHSLSGIGEFDRTISPCDGCYDLAAEVIERYAAMWLGPFRSMQQEGRT